MKPIKQFQIGKKGLTKEIIDQISLAFKNIESMRIHLLKSARPDKEAARKIADELVNALGKNFTYKLIGYVLVIRKWRKPKR